MQNNELEEIYLKYYNELYLYTFSLCKNHYLAEEIVSDSFFKAFVSIEQSTTHIKFWLFRVSKNLWIDYLRKRKHVANSELAENQISQTSTAYDKNSSNDVLEIIIKDETKRTLYNALIKLPESYKEVITLFYFCDFSLNDISKTLGTTSGAARTLLYRARNKLKTILKDVI